MNLRQVTPGDSAGRDDVELVHLPGMNHHDHRTFCGHSWIPGALYEETSDSVTCPHCLRAAAQAVKILRDARIIPRTRAPRRSAND